MSSTSHKCSITVRSGEFGGQGNIWIFLSCSSNHFWSIFIGIWTMGIWTIPIVGTFGVEQGSSWVLWPVSSYTAPYTANNDVLWVALWSITFFSSPTCFNEPWVTMTLTLVHRLSFLTPTLVCTNQCILRTPDKTSHYPSLFGPCQSHSDL